MTFNRSAARLSEPGLSWAMLFIVPLCWALVYFLYIHVVDLVWLYGSTIPESYVGKADLATSLAGRPTWIHFVQTASPAAIQRWGLMFGVSIAFAALCELGNLEVGVGRSFALALFSFAGAVLAALLAAFRLAFFPSQHLFPQQLDPLSLSSLQNFEFFNPYLDIGSQVSLVLIVNVGILAYGLRRVRQLSWATAALYAALPYALVYGARLYFAGQV